MSNPKALIDMNDGKTVSNTSPQSPSGRPLLDPITLDFDPMSFEFKEGPSPLTSPDNEHAIDEMISPSQELDVVDFFDPLCPVKEESPTDCYPNVMFGQTELLDTLNDQEPFSNGYSNFETQEKDLLNMSYQEDLIGMSSHTDNIDDPLDYEEYEIKKSKAKEAYFESEYSFTSSKPDFSADVEVLAELENLQDKEVCISPENEQVFDDNQHDLITQHEHYQIFEEDNSRRSRTSSSSSHSSRSDRIDKKSIYKSSESNYKSEISESNSISKIEKENQKKDSPVKKLSSNKPETNGYMSHNGINKTVSMKNNKNSEFNDRITDEEKIDCLSSLSDLRSTYVSLTTQESQPIATKEIISTGIDINSLKSNYAHQSDDHRGISPERELISTGIDVKALKTSFTKSTEELHQSVFQEEVKPSVDRIKVQRTFSQTPQDELCLCKICKKHVYQMEKMKAEKNVFHKNCFRCRECNKLLNVDSYSSNEGDIYCKPHFRQLFQPKARFGGEDAAPNDLLNDEGKQRRNEMVIRENVPVELPPDVIRSESKPDHGLNNIPVNLNSIKSRFEAYKEEHHLPSTTDVCTLQRSASVMARLAKYQNAVSGADNENGEFSSSDNEEEYGEDPTVVKPRKHKEKVVFSGMSTLKSQWETGSVAASKEEHIEEKKEELNKLRQRICLGRSESMKAVYEKACQDISKSTAHRCEVVDLGRDVKATHLKERFEKGELINEIEEENMEKARKEKEEDLSVFTEPGIANDAKKLFKQIDATAKSTSNSSKSPNKSPVTDRQNSFHSPVKDVDVIKCSQPTEKEEILVDTTDVTQRFKFFENYSDAPKERKRFQITPPREPAKDDTPDKEIFHDPTIIRAVDVVDDIPSTDTARRMLDKFKALEKETPSMPSGPKPLKRITPPREYTKVDQNHDSSPEPERDPSIVRSSYKVDDDIVVEADTAKSLRAKFENWDTEIKDIRRDEDEDDENFLPQIDTTKNLRAKFEAIRDDTLKPIEKSKPKVNRFIQEQTAINADMCSICSKKVYPMEKMETSGMRIHKNCFRCAHCSCMLRLENYTKSGRNLYCTPHFKQLFISRGNYDEGFGREQHKEKWNRSLNNVPLSQDLQEGDDLEFSNGDVQCFEQTA